MHWGSHRFKLLLHVTRLIFSSSEFLFIVFFSIEKDNILNEKNPAFSFSIFSFASFFWPNHKVESIFEL